MTTKKLPVSLNDSEQAAIHRLAGLLGWSGIYGEEAKTLKFGITFTLAAVEQAEKTIPRLEGAELDAFFATVKNCRAARLARENLEIAQKQVEKYSSSPTKSISSAILKPIEPAVSEIKRGS